METTTDYFGELLESTTLSSVAYSQLLSAADILSDNDSESSGHSTIDHHDSHQITFEIPSHSDLERIQHLDRFSTLLKQLGKTVYNSDHADIHAVAMSADGHTITSEQISNSAVLNLADLKNSANGLERYFQGADMHSIINYLWIGVVSALVVLSVIFILFSCYFYRKFREWKKCNKDIHAHMTNNDMYPGSSGGSTTPCDTLLSFSQSPAEAAYFQKESPPCYTIATGLPTYDEALHHQHFAFGMKFVYPGLTAVHHHVAISGNMTGTTAAATPTTNWEKHDLYNSNKDQQQQQQQQCQQQQHHEQQQQQQKQHKLKTSKSASSLFHAAATSDVYDLPPEAAASVALLGPPESSVCCIDMSECCGQDALLDDRRAVATVAKNSTTTTIAPTIATISEAATATTMNSTQAQEITDDSSSVKSDESVIVVVFAA